MAEKRNLYDIKSELRRENGIDGIPLLGLKGKAARVSFLVVGSLLCIGVAIECSGLCEQALQALLKLGKVVVFLLLPILLPPAAYMVWRETWGRRFPLAALASLAVLVALCAVVAWMFGQALACGGVIDAAKYGEEKTIMSVTVLVITWLMLGAFVAYELCSWLDKREEEKIEEEALAIYKAQQDSNATK